MQARLILASLFVIVSALGCVTSGKYDKLQSERDDLLADRDALRAERDALMVEQDAITQELEVARAENEEMKSTYGELVRELQSEVEAGQIQAIRVTPRGLRRTWYAAIPNHRADAPAIRKLVRTLKEHGYRAACECVG